MAGVKTGISGQINNNIVTDGLVFYVDAAYNSSYPGSGTSINGLATGKTATMSGCTFENIQGGSWDFDGVEDIIESNFSRGAFTSETVDIWIKIDNVDAARTIWDNRDSASDGTSVFINTTSNIHYRLNGNDITTSISGLIANWISVIVTYDGSTRSIYINGSLSNSNSYSSTFNVVDNFSLGRRPWNAADGFLGNISNCKYYTRALSAGEVLQNYQAQKERFGL